MSALTCEVERANPICGEPATVDCTSTAIVHQVWEPDGFGDRPRLLVCRADLARVAAMYAPPEYLHDPTEECAHPEAIFLPAENRCAVPDPAWVDEVESFLRHPATIGAT